MIKLSDIVKDYGVSKEEVLSLLKEHTGKEYSPKTSRIGDSTFEKIKPFLTTNKKSTSTDKVLTSHDVDEVDFLAASL
ncbi:hypothetical protein MNB_SV-13-1212 [hydrothermal vent metagenome]|uniref:Translation initiation factor 2 n=1 Tax=hydrothermal vent metagenome TaxID=652676 RepID=A0A1W1CBW8_9ZZZZ